MSVHQIAELEFVGPMTPGVEALIRVLHIRLGLFNDTSERLEDFSLGGECGEDGRFPGQTEILDHGDADAFKRSAVQRL